MPDLEAVLQFSFVCASIPGAANLLNIKVFLKSNCCRVTFNNCNAKLVFLTYNPIIFKKINFSLLHCSIFKLTFSSLNPLGEVFENFFFKLQWTKVQYHEERMSQMCLGCGQVKELSQDLPDMHSQFCRNSRRIRS